MLLLLNAHHAFSFRYRQSLLKQLENMSVCLLTVLQLATAFCLEYMLIIRISIKVTFDVVLYELLTCAFVCVLMDLLIVFCPISPGTILRSVHIS